jgi:hypothetical protein
MDDFVVVRFVTFAHQFPDLNVFQKSRFDLSDIDACA